MKTKLLVLLLLAVGVYSCCEEELPLPPETQTGANTFGCYVNEELFVAPRVSSTLYFYSGYGSTIEIMAYGKNGRIFLNILNPIENTITNAFIVSAKIGENYYEGLNWFAVDGGTSVTGNQNIGEIYITKLDTVNKFASGIFHCKMGDADLSPKHIDTYVLDPKVYVTQGRFDISMEIRYYNNW